jgi:hypothetical protein
VPKQEEISTGTPKRLRSEGSTLTETARPPKRPRDSSGPGNYKQALTNTEIAIFKETYPEDKLTTRPGWYSGRTGKGAARDSKGRSTTPKALQTGGRCLEENESATHILRDCEAIAHLRFRHLSQFFMEPSDFYDAPISKVLHFILSVGLIKG